MTEEIDILLIEDNPNDVELTSYALRRHHPDLSIVVARDGVEALQVLGITPDDKDDDSYTDFNIMAFSGAISEKDGSPQIDKLKEIGIKSFLTKPFTAEALLRSIHETIE